MTPAPRRPSRRAVSARVCAAPARGRGAPAHLAGVENLKAFAGILFVNVTDHPAFVAKAG